jgi:hypothetical protein
MSPPIPGTIDAGIARAVRILQENGIETFESCEGGEGHAFPEPTVRFYGRHTGFKAFTVAMEHGLPVMALRLTYYEYDRVLDGPHWEIVFREPVRDIES